MTECDNAEMRDLLPDLVNDALSSDERERVREHVASCGACSDEEILLRSMRAARPVAPRVDVARIVRALPRGVGMPVSASTTHAAEPLLTVSRSDAIDPPRKRMVFSGVLRMAATVAVAAIGGWTVLSYQRAEGPLDVASRARSAETTKDITQSAVPSGSDARGVQSVGGQLAMVDTPRAGGNAPAGAATHTATRQTALSLGDLSDYSDDDLQRMLDRLEKWDGTTATDPVPTVPIVPVTERGTR